MKPGNQGFPEARPLPLLERLGARRRGLPEERQPGCAALLQSCRVLPSRGDPQREESPIRGLRDKSTGFPSSAREGAGKVGGGRSGVRPSAPGGRLGGAGRPSTSPSADRRADGGATGCGRDRARGAAGSACSTGRRTPAVPGLQAALPAAAAAELLRAVLLLRLLHRGAGRGAGPALPGPGDPLGRRGVGDVCRLRAGSAVPGERARGGGARGALGPWEGGGAEQRWHPHKGETQEWVTDFEAMATPQR